MHTHIIGNNAFVIDDHWPHVIIIKLLRKVDAATGKVVWDGTPLDGMTVQCLLTSTCVPFKKPPDKDVIDFLRQNGIVSFRNHLIDGMLNPKASPPNLTDWVSPYSF